MDVLVEHFEPNDLGPHQHRQWQLVVLMPGAAMQVSWDTPRGSSQRRCLGAGDVWFLPPGWRHSAQWREPTEAIVLYVDDIEVSRYYPELRRTGASIARLTEYTAAAVEVAELCRELRRYSLLEHGRSDWHVAAIGSHLATSLLQGHLRLTNGILEPLPGLLGRVVQRLKLQLNEPHPERLRLGPLARSLGVSDRHLRRIFRQGTGLSPQAWIMMEKARRAVAWLMQGESIKETVELAGFANASHLHRVVFRTYGVSPVAFRRRAQTDAGPFRV